MQGLCMQFVEKSIAQNENAQRHDGDIQNLDTADSSLASLFQPAKSNTDNATHSIAYSRQ